MIQIKISSSLKKLQSNRRMSCMKFHLVLGLCSLHGTDFEIEFMVMKSARNVKVGVEDRVQSNFDKFDTGSRNNK